MKLQESTDADRSITVTSEGILSNLNPHKAAGPDQIKPIILKTHSTPLSPILKHLYLRSHDFGTFPPTWKDTNVAPVYKNVNVLTLPTTGPYTLYSL